jgi:GH15 family glucan-1,4-alpha-glucosidase
MKAQAYPPIGDYALLSDCHSGALVSKDGSIDWCTFHRFEARPVFARLLDWSKGGFFRIAPATDEYEVTRRYLPGTNVLETRFETSDGVITLTDCFSVKTAEGHPEHRLLRKVRCESGELRVKAKFEPRCDYGLTEPRVEQVADDLVVAYGGPDALMLQTDLGIGTAEISACETAQTISAGDEAWLVLTWSLPHELEAVRLSHEQIEAELEGTERFWREWSDRCEYDGPYREQVVRSALVLKALTNGPTGGRSSPRRRRPCRRRSAASATGTTASPGSAIRP